MKYYERNDERVTNKISDGERWLKLNVKLHDMVVGEERHNETSSNYRHFVVGEKCIIF